MTFTSTFSSLPGLSFFYSNHPTTTTNSFLITDLFPSYHFYFYFFNSTKICSQLTYRLRDCWRRLLCSTSASSVNTNNAINEDHLGTTTAPELIIVPPSTVPSAITSIPNVDQPSPIANGLHHTTKKKSIIITDHHDEEEGENGPSSLGASISRILLAGCRSRRGDVIGKHRSKMGANAASSSPEPNQTNPDGTVADRNVVERAWRVLNQKPLKMSAMLRLSRLMNEATYQEKLTLLHAGVLDRLLEMIDERSHMVPKSATVATTTTVGANGEAQPSASTTTPPNVAGASTTATPTITNPNPRPNSKSATTYQKKDRSKANGKSRKGQGLTFRGVGYGFGSTRSQWDIERTLEEQMIREEQLVWLMNALTSFLYRSNPDFRDYQRLLDTYRGSSDNSAANNGRAITTSHSNRSGSRSSDQLIIAGGGGSSSSTQTIGVVDPINVVDLSGHVTQELADALENSSIIPMMEYHLRNESIFDISEHMEFYQSMLELACSMCLHSKLAPILIRPRAYAYKNGPPRSARTAERFVWANLLPHFRDQISIYLNGPSMRMGSPDFRLVDFIDRVRLFSDFALEVAARFERSNRGATAMISGRRPSPPTTMVIIAPVGQSAPFGLASTVIGQMPSTDQQNGQMLPIATTTSPSAHTLSSSYSSTSSSTASSTSTAANSTSTTASAQAVLLLNAYPSSPFRGDSNNTSSNDMELIAANPMSSGLVFNLPQHQVPSAMLEGGVIDAADVLPSSVPENESALMYTNALKKYQINTWKFIGDFGKLVIPFTYRKEAKSLNPYSPSLKERTKRIARELASLHNALPMNWSNSIFVAVDEGRCDLMKVLITGPDDTPYQNGCFEFDLFFPSGYPFSPPKVTFLTTGNGEVRFNPNLYQDGKVCLSILNTWEGRPEEKWNPYCSLLQVLISIQALIFVKEPYFNEPGFERYVGTDKGRHLSHSYNQQLQHATLHYAVLEQLKSPPEYFRDVIRRHFWYKREAIIEQAQDWLSQAHADVLANAKEKDQKESKKNNNASSLSTAAALESGLGVVSVRSMERTVEALLQEVGPGHFSKPLD